MSTPVYHVKTKKQVDRMGAIFGQLQPILKAKNIPLVIPHPRFIIAREEDYAELTYYVKDGELCVVEIVKREDADEFYEYARKEGRIPKEIMHLTNEELYWQGNRASVAVAAGFCLMLEYGVFDVRTRKEITNVTPINRQQRRQLTREEAFHKWIEVRPHTHVKQRILKGIEESQKEEPWFRQKVRSHLRRLDEDRVTIVKEHLRYAHLPERPQIYNASRMAQESRPCKPCIGE